MFSQRSCAFRLAAMFWMVPALSALSQVPHLLHHQGRVAIDGVNLHGIGQFKFAFVDAGTNISRQASATATVTGAGGFLTAVTVTDGGAGYTTTPEAVAQDIKGGGLGAVLKCVVSGGAVTAINVLDAGSGYTASTTIVIAAPPTNIVYQSFWRNADDTSPADGEPDAAVSLAVNHGLFDVLLGDATVPNMAAVPASVFGNPDLRLRVWFNDGSHGFQKLAPDKRIAAVGYAVLAENVPDAAITSAKLADAAVTTAKIAPNAVQSPNIASGAVGATQLASGAVTSSKLAAGAVQASNIASGAVTSTQLAPNAVQSSNIASGAVGSAQIASGAITATQLAKPPRSGSISSASMQIDFNQARFSVSFVPSFTSTPVVTLGVRTPSTIPWQPSVWVESSSSGMFTGHFAVPPKIVVPDSEGSAGFYNSLAIVNSCPAISYICSGSLKSVRSYDASGDSWPSPHTVDDLGFTDYSATSMAVINGYPAISYFDGINGNLRFVRATNALGSDWGTPLTVDSVGDVGRDSSLAVVNGNPAISYLDFTLGNLKYVRATDASGTAWGAPITVDGVGLVGWDTTLAVVNGYPAISYYDETNGDLKFVRATNASGTAWSAPVTIDSVGNVGYSNSMAVVNGNPAICYSDFTNGDLKYVRATNASGTAWSAPVTIDSVGNVGYSNSMAVINGNPAISYRDGGNYDLKYVRATNASGTAWSTPITLDSEGDVGAYSSLAEVGGGPAISYRDQTNQELKFVKPAAMPASFTIEWIALEP